MYDDGIVWGNEMISLAAVQWFFSIQWHLVSVYMELGYKLLWHLKESLWLDSIYTNFEQSHI